MRPYTSGGQYDSRAIVTNFNLGNRSSPKHVDAFARKFHLLSGRPRFENYQSIAPGLQAVDY
ncbi:hypothetical protein MPTK1_2g12460 [Marchantia polymorpha subsp. ruderalis]|uniref:Uncharacterized protein n=1 Tax=Marchantia polymorpha TaxID=3197 RepID=A0A2R6XAX2_MARPO|nr:hypothetical protein MARPO_0026s0125 [Marchantia polymorpha]PTQ43256.1 hypothetical protein MARPO_0026s0125 [Marchantia polymorpha]BBN02065.1 hypothetical protein Mp_2g12460 [Marchantia polymorpha subsp. ruderalis]BBN02066.1 hypothetical protein Mp_2g12460 [Marchantia polymorpha subsp. ruderalis]|eukprot:PTQ43255.1 hypothetical protein MARPO_0026s0125 [Marchantia polymorpha]